MSILLDAIVFVNEVFVLILLIEGFYTLTSNYISEVKLIAKSMYSFNFQNILHQQ